MTGASDGVDDATSPSREVAFASVGGTGRKTVKQAPSPSRLSTSNSPRMLGNNTMHDRKAETGCLAHGLGREEQFKSAFPGRFVHARAGIAHDEPDFVCWRRRDADRDRDGAGIAVDRMHRVGDEVDDDLFELAGITEDRRHRSAPVIHPAQIAAMRRVFSPNAADIAAARRAVAADETQGGRLAVVDGRFVEQATYRRAI